MGHSVMDTNGSEMQVSGGIQCFISGTAFPKGTPTSNLQWRNSETQVGNFIRRTACGARRATTSQERCTRIDNNTRISNARKFPSDTTIRGEMPGKRTSWSSSTRKGMCLTKGQAAIRPTVFANGRGEHRAPKKTVRRSLPDHAAFRQPLTTAAVQLGLCGALSTCLVPAEPRVRTNRQVYLRHVVHFFMGRLRVS